MIYMLSHVYQKYMFMDARPEIKLLGYYSSIETVHEAIEEYKVLPGFRDHKHSFYVKPIDIDVTGEAVFCVDLYQYDEPRYNFEFSDLIIATFDEQKAKEMLHLCEKETRMFYQKNTQTELILSRNVLDKRYWEEGFN